MKKYFLLLPLLYTMNLSASVDSICSEKDSRVQMQNEPIARISKKGINSGCTATLISENCAVTAGHCEDHLFKGEFNVPKSVDGVAQPAHEKDIYFIDKSSIVFNEGGRGNDWAVFKFKKNENTNLNPGVVYGFYEIELYEPKVQTDLLRIAGNGVHWDDNTLSYTLMGATGFADYIGYSSEGRSLLNHYIDTTPASSGSSVVNVSSNKVIGIHGQGGCGSRKIWNSATLIKGNLSLQNAISKCLENK
jgi:V8-like Glu-specific endopeptidase